MQFSDLKSKFPKSTSYSLIILLILLVILIPTLIWKQTTNLSSLEIKKSSASSLTSPYLFGTLQSDPLHNQSNWDAGIRLAHVDLNWSAYEPSDGQFNSTYIQQQKDKIASLKAQGFKISLGPALHYTPQWLFDSTKYPTTKFTDQFGNNATQSSKFLPNFQFSNTARLKAEEYLNRVFLDLGTDFYSIRINPGSIAGEMEYPHVAQANGFWAFDNNAQGKGTDLPAGTTPSPYPGWKPGDTTWNGQAFTRDQVVTWYKWYHKSLVQVGDWQSAVYKRNGFLGSIVWLTPGSGMRPFDISRYLDHYLMATTTTYADVNGAGLDYDPSIGPVAAVWHWTIKEIADKANIQIQISSMADASGNPWGNDCVSTDDSLSLTNKDYESTGTITSPSTFMASWSDVRWISFIANKYSLVKTGENPGAHDSITLMNKAGSLMASCKLTAWYYAFDYSLYDNVTVNDDPYLTSTDVVAKIADLKTLITNYNGVITTPTTAPTISSNTPVPSIISTGSKIIINAATTNANTNAAMELRINDSVVATFNVTSNTLQQFTYNSPTIISANQVKVAFVNDGRDPINGADINLLVDKINVDGIDFQTETSSTYSTGSWTSTVGCGDGFRSSEILACNGYFFYNQTSNLTPTPTIPVTSSDTTSPTVSITSPVPNSLVDRKSTVNIQVSASDNVGVTKVEFYVNNQLKFTATNAPYNYSWSVPASPNTKYVISTKASDKALNTSTSTINVTSK